MSKEPTSEPLSLSAPVARNLATATVTVPQYTEVTPRWLHKLLPWVDVDGGVYRVNRVAQAAKGHPANEFGEVKVDLLTVAGGEPTLPTTFVDYDRDPREYHLSTIQTVLRTRSVACTGNRIERAGRRRCETLPGTGGRPALDGRKSWSWAGRWSMN